MICLFILSNTFYQPFLETNVKMKLKDNDFKKMFKDELFN